MGAAGRAGLDYRAASSSLQPSLRDLNALTSGPNPESFRGWAIFKCPYGTNPGFRHELDAALVGLSLIQKGFDDERAFRF
jgi:hypothetical protein